MNIFKLIQFRIIGESLRALVVVAFALGWTSPAVAQAPSLQEMLGDILGEQGELGGGGGGGGGLDGAREGALGGDRLGVEDPTSRRVTSGITDEQMVIVRRFCEGRLVGPQMDLLALVPAFSPVEQDYCSRAGVALLQHGYAVFDGFRSVDDLVNGAVPDDYRLGIGDEILVTFRGQISGTRQAEVDREGRVILEDLNPITAAGRTFADFRSEVEARVDAAFVGTDVFLSLGAVRSIAVSVTGEVFSPGIQRLTGLSTIYDAVAQAGGIKKSGSLRSLIVHRDGSTFELDLYNLLNGGPIPREVGLLEGDRIVVPTLGPTIAVSGKVVRPGIYELLKGQAQVTLSEVLEMGGGALRPSGLRISQISYDSRGRTAVFELLDGAAVVRAGDLIELGLSEAAEVGTVFLQGHVFVPGRRARANAQSIGALVGGYEGVKPGAYAPFAVLETTDPSTRGRRLFAVDLTRILNGLEDYALKDGDRFTVLSEEDVRFLSSSDVFAAVRSGEMSVEVLAQQSLREAQEQVLLLNQQLQAANERIEDLRAGFVAETGSGGPAQIKTCKGLEAVASISRRSERFVSVVEAMTTLRGANFPIEAQPGLRSCPAVWAESVTLLPFVLEHAAVVRGEVRLPGVYPIVRGSSIASIISAAGGVTREADLSHVEITRYFSDVAPGAAKVTRGFADLTGGQEAAVTIEPGDVLRFNRFVTERDAGPVLLAGEVLRPGYYDIRRGETLSELLARAGGLTPQAYPYGAVFTRESVKKAEREAFILAARELDAAAISAAARQDVGVDAVAAMRQITAAIAAAEPVGRVVIEADPTVLQVRPDLDLVLQPGDTLFMPKRPNSVLVIGDVLNPGAQQFLPGTRAERYIANAGGFHQSADQDRVYLVYPNGVAEPLRVSVWNYSALQIPPGSTIVAPKDPAPFDLLRLTSEVASVVSQIAVTLASLAVLTD